MKFELRIAHPARRKLLRLDRVLQGRILTHLDKLCADPLSSPFSDWVEGGGSLRKSRVGSWRVIFAVDTARRIVDVRSINQRGQAYRLLN